ncbi:MAG: hypothetical protein OEZ54_12110 [Gemmatimonadota bacterium]|nr:hypothetical protein [Gemmatimonadota bacterium]
MKMLLPRVIVPALLLIATSPIQGQIDTYRIDSFYAELEEPFTRVVSVAEFPDGRLLVVDQRERSVSIVDFESGTRANIGREGRGPGEYLRPFAIVTLPGDTLSVYDSGNRRLFLVAPNGRSSTTRNLPEELFGAGGLSQPRGADRNGNIYFEKSSFASTQNIPTHASILRVNVATGSVDSVAAVLVRDSLNRRVLHPFVQRDAWDVLRNGSLTVVRGSDHHIEIITSGNVETKGQGVDFTPAPLTDHELQAYRDSEQARQGAQVALSRGGSSGGNRSDETEIRNLRRDWVMPEHLPRFRQETTFLDTEGRLFVQRVLPWNATSTSIDVFSVDGNRMAVLEISEKLILAGTGSRTLYLVRTDAVGFQWLRKYDLPEIEGL